MRAPLNRLSLLFHVVYIFVIIVGFFAKSPTLQCSCHFLPPLELDREEFFQGSGHSNAMNRNQRYRDSIPEVTRDPNTAYGMQRLQQHPFQQDNRILKRQQGNRSRCDSGTSEQWENKICNENQQNNSQNNYQQNNSQMIYNGRNNRPGFAKF